MVFESYERKNVIFLMILLYEIEIIRGTDYENRTFFDRKWTFLSGILE